MRKNRHFIYWGWGWPAPRSAMQIVFVLIFGDWTNQTGRGKGWYNQPPAHPVAFIMSSCLLVLNWGGGWFLHFISRLTGAFQRGQNSFFLSFLRDRSLWLALCLARLKVSWVSETNISTCYSDWQGSWRKRYCKSIYSHCFSVFFIPVFTQITIIT